MADQTPLDLTAIQAREAAIEAGAREWDDLRTSGLLWLINATTFHPRGFALGIVYHDGKAVGWRLGGDGTEPWSYGDEEIIKQRFRDAQAAFARQGGGDAGDAREGVSAPRRRDGGTAGVTYVAAPAENVPALLAEIIALRTRIAGYESALNFQTTCTGCADYLDQLLDRDVEIQRLRALVGEEGQPGWDNIDRAEAIRQAEESHADRLQWIRRFDALRDQRDAEIERLRDEVTTLRAERDGQAELVKHWHERWEAACAREDALAASAVNRHVEIKRLLDKAARLETQRDAVLAVAALHDYCDCGDADDIRAALGAQMGEQP